MLSYRLARTTRNGAISSCCARTLPGRARAVPYRCIARVSACLPRYLRERTTVDMVNALPAGGRRRCSAGRHQRLAAYLLPSPPVYTYLPLYTALRLPDGCATAWLTASYRRFLPRATPRFTRYRKTLTGAASATYAAISGRRRRKEKNSLSTSHAAYVARSLAAALRAVLFFARYAQARISLPP